MQLSNSVGSRLTVAVVACCLMWSATGCSTTPQSRLHGRWFNSEISIRFRTDGTVIYNSSSGLATGRYFFDGEVRPAASEEPVPNLTMDLERNGAVFRVDYELQFLGSDRLRIQTTESRAERLSPRALPPVVILKRAENEDLNTFASAG